MVFSLSHFLDDFGGERPPVLPRQVLAVAPKVAAPVAATKEKARQWERAERCRAGGTPAREKKRRQRTDRAGRRNWKSTISTAGDRGWWKLYRTVGKRNANFRSTNSSDISMRGFDVGTSPSPTFHGCKLRDRWIPVPLPPPFLPCRTFSARGRGAETLGNRTVRARTPGLRRRHTRL
jgi:hypothetical protein